MCTHISSHRFRLLCKHKWGERERERKGAKERERGGDEQKRGGRASIDKDSSAVLPSTHIHSDPLSSVPLSSTRCSHHMAANAQMISSIHTCAHAEQSNSHTCTHPSTSSSEHSTDNTFTQLVLSSHSSRTRQGCLLLPVSEPKGGVRRRRRRRRGGEIGEEAVAADCLY